MIDSSQNLSREIDPRFNDLKSFLHEEKKTFATEFQKFLSKVLSEIIFYLPTDDTLVDNSDFVTLTYSLQARKEKIYDFNEKFQIVSEGEIPKLNQEINTLMSQDFLRMKVFCKESSLHLWSMIEGMSSTEDVTLKYPTLSKIFKVAHCLPISSSCIEQTFSSLKLIKSNIRSNSQESTTQSLLLIIQKYQNKLIVIDDDMVEEYEAIKSALNVRKSNHRILTQQVVEEAKTNNEVQN